MKPNSIFLHFFTLLAVSVLLFGCLAGQEMKKPVEEKAETADEGAVMMEKIAPQQMWFYGRPLYEIYLRAYSPEGRISALTANLDQFKAMGIETIWIMPIFPNGELGRKGSAGSPYAVRDYFNIAEEYGTLEDFAELVNQAHQRGMKIMLDMVMNHSSNDYPLMEQHPDWWYHDSTGAFSREVPDWSDVTDWNYDNDEAREYLKKALLFWVRDYDVDGYRCDVAGFVPNDFWKPVINELREIKPDLFMLAEWEDYSLLNAGFNAAYDWTLYHRLFAHREGTVGLDSLWRVIDGVNKTIPAGKLMMRFVENHDERRSAEKFGWPEVKPYAALIYTLPGIPLLYSGQEAGETHKPSLFEPEPIDWSAADPEVNQFYRELLALRNGNNALLRGGCERVAVDAPEVLVFQRECKSQRLLVAINFSEEEQTVTLSETGANTPWVELTGEGLPMNEGSFTLPVYGYKIFAE